MLSRRRLGKIWDCECELALHHVDRGNSVIRQEAVAPIAFVLHYRTMARPVAGALELTILLAVSRLGADAYGLAIRDDVSERTGHDYSVGAIYTTLQRLEDKGLVASRLSDPQPIRGGRARREFKLTAAGAKALRDARRIAASVWAGAETNLRPRPA
jgi:PadR family transcriptional regulator, regulatory protein PadR